MKAEKTRHLFNELTMLFAGFRTELCNGSVAHAHLNASEKEITELERLATLGRYVEMLFTKDETAFISHDVAYDGHGFSVIGDVDELTKWGEDNDTRTENAATPEKCKQNT